MSKSTSVREIINILENIDLHYKDDNVEFNEFELKYSNGTLNIYLTPTQKVEHIDMTFKIEPIEKATQN